MWDCTEVLSQSVFIILVMIHYRCCTDWRMAVRVVCLSLCMSYLVPLSCTVSSAELEHIVGFRAVS